MHGLQGQGMARTGRKRKAGPRYPSGEPVREKQESPHEIALRQPHRRNAPLSMADDQRAETPLGCLNLIGAVSNDEYRSATRFARIVARYRAVIEAPKQDADSIAGAMEPKGRKPDIDDADAEERKAEYDQAFIALQSAGHSSAVTVARVAIQGQPCPHRGFGALVRGLRALRECFELTDRAKPIDSTNRS